jgi:hypothetical protein
MTTYHFKNKINMYYNTTNEKGVELAESTKKAKTQEAQLLQMYRMNRQLSASQAWKMYPGKNTPLTSIRRGISNLCKAGKLVKTDQMVKGLYGKNEYLYKYKN